MGFLSGPESPESEERIPQPRHLKEGVPAIMACVGTPDEFRENPGAEKFAFREKIKDIPGADNVDYFGDHGALAKQNFKNPKEFSYVISPIDDLDKFSKSFANCTGLVVTGYDKKTGKNISFLSHQDPGYFLDSEANRDRFMSDLRQRLAELKERCDEGTIDAAIMGGNYFKAKDLKNYETFQADYLESVGILSDEATKILGFEPVVITGPKVIRRGESVFYENNDRRLYISRPEVGDASTESFAPSDIKKQEKKW